MKICILHVLKPLVLENKLFFGMQNDALMHGERLKG